MRDSARLIVRREVSGDNGGNGHYRFQNVYRARALGLEAAFEWTSPGRYVSVQASPSWIEQRNRSKSGAFAEFEGDRIPNRPYLFASWGGQLRFAGLAHAGDVLEPFYQGRYVHAFYRSWESAGLRAFKKEVDAQVTQTLGITYSLRGDAGFVASTLELQNLTDAKVFDFFGVQRPGRAIYLKVSGEL